MKYLIIIILLCFSPPSLAQSETIVTSIKTISDPEKLGMEIPTQEEIRRTKNCCRFAQYRPDDAPEYCKAPDMVQRVQSTPACENIP